VEKGIRTDVLIATTRRELILDQAQRDRSTAAIELSRSGLAIGAKNCEMHHRKAISAPTELVFKEVAKMFLAWFQIGVSEICASPAIRCGSRAKTFRSAAFCEISFASKKSTSRRSGALAIKF